jgi:hypothetical protein
MEIFAIAQHLDTFLYAIIDKGGYEPQGHFHGMV